MPTFYPVQPIDKSSFDKLGYSWYCDNDGSYFVDDKLIKITESEAKAYYKAANTIYEMYLEGAEYVIQKNLFNDLDINPNMIDLIKYSWKHERNNHLYSRFDFSGGIDGLPIKLIEFNADTPTLLIESTLIQWQIFKYNNMQSKSQFNNIYEALLNKFKSMIDEHKQEHLVRCLFSSIDNVSEEINTTKLLQKIAIDAGISSDFKFMQDISFNDFGVLDNYDNLYDFWFKLYPWEEISDEEKELINILSLNYYEKKTRTLNPAYTLLFQSKGMMKILYDLFPDSQYLLKTSFNNLDEKCVKKPMFGREGANIDIIDSNKKTIYSSPGQYDKRKCVYQTYVNFPEDNEGYKYQAGVFFSDYACGLSFRQGNIIMNDMSKFMGHIIKNS